MTGPAGAPALVPDWLAESAAVGWRLLVVIGMAAVALGAAAAVPASTTAILVSLVLAATLAPTAAGLRRRGLSRSAAAAIAFGLAAALIVLAVVALLAILAPDVRLLVVAVEHGLAEVRARLSELGLPEAATAILALLGRSARESLSPDPAALASMAADVGMVVVLGTFLTFFLLADGDVGWAHAMGALQPWQAASVTASAQAGLTRMAWYVRRTALLAAADAAAVAVVLLAAGAPLPGALAAVALVAGFVPYLGAIAGGAVIFLATLATAGSAPAVAVLAALIATTLAGSRLLERTAMGGSTDVNPGLVLIAIPAGFALLGVLGVLALLPMTVFALAISKAVRTALSVGPAPGGTAEDPASAGLPAGVPLWLERLAQWSWRGLVLAGLALVAVLAVNRMPALLAPVALGLVGAATLLPVVDRLERRGLGRGPAAALSMGVLTAVTVVAIAASAAMAVGPLREVVDAAVAGAGRLDAEWLREAASRLGSELQVDVAGFLGSTVGLVLAIAMAMLLSFFLLRDGPRWWHASTDQLAPGRREPVQAAGSRAVAVLAGYMGGTAIISLFGGVTSGLIMVILGLPLALPIAVLGTILGFVPYIGSALTTLLALLVTLAFGTTLDVALMLVFTVVFNIVQGNIVTPIVYGRTLSLHAAVVLMAIPIGGELAGILGMFLLVPVVAIAAATWRLIPAAITGSGLPQGALARAGAGATAEPG